MMLSYTTGIELPLVFFTYYVLVEGKGRLRLRVVRGSLIATPFLCNDVIYLFLRDLLVPAVMAGL